MSRYCIILLLCFSECVAQNLNSLGNYAGLTSISNSPSLPVLSKLGFDLNLFGLNASAFNNFIGMTVSDQSVRYAAPHHGKLFVNTEMNGPGLMLRRRNYTFAFKVSSQTLACANGISRQTSDMVYNAIAGEQTPHLTFALPDGKQLNAISYGEIAFNLSRIAKYNERRIISIGFTAKLLMGYAAASVSCNNNRLIVDTSTGKVTAYTDLTYAYAMPDPSHPGPVLQRRGTGFGADLGFTYVKRMFNKPRYRGCPSVVKRYLKPDDYKWRFSVAILDIGGIRFGRDARMIRLHPISTTLDTVSLKEIRNSQNLDSILRKNAEQSSGSGSFYAGMPTTLVVQYDRRICRGIFVYYYLSQRLLSNAGIRMFKANQVSICPRFESMNWDLGIKLGAMEYTFPMIGAAIRFKSLSLGADYISDFSLRTLYGMQLSLRIGIHQVRGKKMPALVF